MAFMAGADASAIWALTFTFTADAFICTIAHLTGWILTVTVVTFTTAFTEHTLSPPAAHVACTRSAAFTAAFKTTARFTPPGMMFDTRGFKTIICFPVQTHFLHRQTFHQPCILISDIEL
jgi:hypothetical protein